MQLHLKQVGMPLHSCTCPDLQRYLQVNTVAKGGLNSSSWVYMHSRAHLQSVDDPACTISQTHGSVTPISMCSS